MNTIDAQTGEIREIPMQSETIGKLAEALAKAQGKIKGAARDADNPFFKSKYADLASVWDACRDHLSANGLSVFQTTEDGAEGVTVVTTLAHSSGEWVRGRLTLKPVKNDPQGIGSTITYARRYALAAIVGVAPEDDDGNAASGVNGNTPAKRVMTGPLKVTEMKNKLRALAEDINACNDASELQGMVTDNKAVLDQAKTDLPDWYERLDKIICDRETYLLDAHNPLAAA